MDRPTPKEGRGRREREPRLLPGTKEKKRGFISPTKNRPKRRMSERKSTSLLFMSRGGKGQGHLEEVKKRRGGKQAFSTSSVVKRRLKKATTSPPLTGGGKKGKDKGSFEVGRRERSS